MRVRFTRPARDDLDRIRIFIAGKNPQAARRVTAAIRAAAAHLADFPLMAPEADVAGVRVKLAAPYPFLVFYTVRNDEVLVLRVRHDAQKPPTATDL